MIRAMSGAQYPLPDGQGVRERVRRTRRLSRAPESVCGRKWIKQPQPNFALYIYSNVNITTQIFFLKQK
jgi:hypothetical protein